MDTLCPLPLLPSLPPRSYLPVTPVALLSVGKAARPCSEPFAGAGSCWWDPLVPEPGGCPLQGTVTSLTST